MAIDFRGRWIWAAIQFFLSALANGGAAPQIIDDDLGADIVCAAVIGTRSVLVKTEKGATVSGSYSENVAPDIVLSSIADLPPILKAPFRGGINVGRKYYQLQLREIMKEFFVFIETNATTGRLFAQKARNYGLEPIMLTRFPANFPFLETDGISARTVETRSVEALSSELKEIDRIGKVRGIASSSDWGVLEAATLAGNLGMPGANPDTIRLCRDKSAQRALLKQHGHDDTPQYICTTAEECGEAARQIKGPVVVKPISSSGSIAARHCPTPTEAYEHALDLLKLSLDWRRRPEFVVEAAISGNQYSLEVFNGKLIGIVRQHYGDLPFFVASGHDFPASLNAKHEQMLTDFAKTVIELFDLNWGGAHIEVRLDALREKVVLIEVNPRLVSAYVPELIRHTAGLDLIDATIRQHLGLPVDLNVSTSDYGAMRFLMTQSSGIFSPPKETNQRKFVRDIGLYIKPGATLAKANDFRDRYGHVISVAPTFCDALDSAEQVVRDYNCAIS
jgi:argininosuccinate lyase